MARYTIVLLAVVFVIVAGILAYLISNNFFNKKVFMENKDEIAKESEDLEAGDKGADSELNLPFQGSNDRESDAGISGGGNNGGSSGGSSSSGENSGMCDVQIPYGLKDFSEVEICKEYDGSICIDKSINCSLVVHNLHNDIEGIFKIKFALFRKGGPEMLDFSIVDIYLGPGNFERHDFLFDLGNASEEIECKFFTESVPKEKC